MFNDKIDNQAYIGLDIPISSANIDDTGFMLNESAKYTAKNGSAVISTANTNLDGTGTLSSAIITGASNGTLINSIIIKALTNTTQGMVRLFVYDNVHSSYYLIEEIEIPAITKSGRDSSFEFTVPMYLYLNEGWVLYASTEKAETFNVCVESVDWTYPEA